MMVHHAVSSADAMHANKPWEVLKRKVSNVVSSVKGATSASASAGTGGRTGTDSDTGVATSAPGAAGNAGNAGAATEDALQPGSGSGSGLQVSPCAEAATDNDNSADFM